MDEYFRGIEYYRSQKIRPIIIRDFIKKIPLSKMDLDFYKNLDLNEEFLLDNNFQRFIRFNIKTLHHGFDEDYYPFKLPFAKNRIIAFILYITSKRILAKQYPKIVHYFIYYFSKIARSALDLFSENQKILEMKYYLEDLNDISLYNKEKGFTIIAKKVLQYYFAYRSILKKIKPDFVLSYNGNWANQTPCIAACEKLGIPHYMTDGSSFIGYSHFDSENVWFDGDINRRALHELTQEQEQKIDAWIEGRIQKFKRGIASFMEDKQQLTKSPKPKKLVGKFIIAPLQILDDTNNLKYSPFFPDMVTFVKAVIDATPKDYTVIIKRHPWDVIWVDAAYMENLKVIKEYIKDKPNIILVQRLDVHKLLKNAAALVCINSTMLLENTYMAQAPMVVVGDIFIRGWGFTYDVNSLDDLPKKIAEAIKTGVTSEMKKKMKQWLYMYVFEHLVPGNYEAYLGPNKSYPENYEPMAQRILQEIREIEKRKNNGLPPRLPKLGKDMRCMIDRSQFPRIKYF